MFIVIYLILCVVTLVVNLNNPPLLLKIHRPSLNVILG